MPSANSTFSMAAGMNLEEEGLEGTPLHALGNCGSCQRGELWLATLHPWSLICPASQTSHLSFLPALFGPSLALSPVWAEYLVPQDLDACYCHRNSAAPWGGYSSFPFLLTPSFGTLWCFLRVGSRGDRLADDPRLGAMEVEANGETLGSCSTPRALLWCLWPQSSCSCGSGCVWPHMAPTLHTWMHIRHLGPGCAIRHSLGPRGLPGVGILASWLSPLFS